MASNQHFYTKKICIKLPIFTNGVKLRFIECSMFAGSSFRVSEFSSFRVFKLRGCEVALSHYSLYKRC